jgi:hypothetical protein
MSNDATLAPRLRADIERSGYYPELVSDTLDTALADEPVVAYVVHHEATFDHDELRRHVTVLALTPTRLIVGHTDEHPADETSSRPYATASTEAVRIERIDSVVVTRVAAEAEKHRRGAPVREVDPAHRHGVQRRPGPAGERGGRRRRGRRADARLRLGALRGHGPPHALSPSYGSGCRVTPGPDLLRY